MGGVPALYETAEKGGKEGCAKFFFFSPLSLRGVLRFPYLDVWSAAAQEGQAGLGVGARHEERGGGRVVVSREAGRLVSHRDERFKHGLRGASVNLREALRGVVDRVEKHANLWSFRVCFVF